MTAGAKIELEGDTSFTATLAVHGMKPLRRDRLEILQVNLGKLCNQACHHCHVDASPTRTEIMDEATARRVGDLIESSQVGVVDFTGGAPELNPHFRSLVKRARRRGASVTVRCNLTVLFVAGQEDLAHFYRDNDVALICSLPCYTAENVDRQRGEGVFTRSIEALRLLNRVGYGLLGTGLSLDLVYNPGGASLPPPQRDLEARYRSELRALFGIEFGRLLTITNMPIRRFAEQLQRRGEYERYMSLLVESFNPAAAAGVMCRTLLSVGWDGRLYDCDFNQMLELSVGAARPHTIWDIDDLRVLVNERITTAAHCFGCTAGAGSSCGGALAD
jgi:radical SAM/Cys-rich protein